MSNRISLSVPCLEGKESEYLIRCIKDNWVSSSGPFVSEFEKIFSETVGSKYAVACSSGTAALHLALLASGVKATDYVLVSNLTFIASANVIRYVGAEPVLVDSESSSWQIDPLLIENFLKNDCFLDKGQCFHKQTKKRIAAILPVHILGHSADIENIINIAKAYGISVIEDAAEALGVTFNNKQVGHFGKAGCFSFNGNKIITSGSGGMVITDSKELADRVKYLSQQAKSESHDYIHEDIGYNYRMSNLHAAVGLAQLEQLESHIKRKIEIADRYRRAFESIPGISWIEPIKGSNPTWWMFTIRINKPNVDSPARELMEKLNQAGIEGRRLWQPMNLSVPYQTCVQLGGENSVRFYNEALSLPSSVGLSNGDQDRVIAEVMKASNN